MRLASTNRSTRWSSWLFTIALAGLLIALHNRLYQYAFDDAYIHFRVARNLLQTGNPYYNTGEMVKVSTSSGWTVFLAVLFGIARLFKIDNNLPVLVGTANALATLCGMLVYTKVMETLLKQRFSSSKKVLFQVPYLALLLPSSVGLMETPLALLLAGWGIYSLLQSRPAGFAVLGAAAYIRLELSGLLGLAGLFVALRRQIRLRDTIGFTAIGFLPLLLFDLYFFQTVVPQSIVAKGIVYSIAWYQPALHALLYSLPAVPLCSGLCYLGIGGLLLIIAPLAALAALREGMAVKSFWPALFYLWSLLVIGGYILGRAFVFDWYIPLYTIPFLVACSLCSVSTEGGRNIVLCGFLCVLFVMSAISLTSVLYASVLDPGAYSQFEPGARVRTYLNVGATLNDEYPTATRLTSEIGALGYSFRGRILDAAGLASPGALAFHPMRIPEDRSDGTIGAIPPGYVKAQTPDLIVSYDTFAQALIDDEVSGQYTVIRIPAYLADDAIYSRTGLIWGSRYLRVYIRKNLQISERVQALGQ